MWVRALSSAKCVSTSPSPGDQTAVTPKYMGEKCRLGAKNQKPGLTPRSLSKTKLDPAKPLLTPRSLS